MRRRRIIDKSKKPQVTRNPETDLSPLVWIRLRLEELMNDYRDSVGRKVTQTEFSELIGVSDSTLSRYRKGQSEHYSRDALTKISQFFDCSLNDLFEFPSEVDLE